MAQRSYSNRLRHPFEGRVAIVAGGTSGIGRALCPGLGRCGATVVVAGRTMERADEVVRQIRANGRRARADRGDVTRQSEVDRLVARTVERFGRLDCMFKNAGVAILGEAHDISIEDWRWVMDVNLRGGSSSARGRRTTWCESRAEGTS